MEKDLFKARLLSLTALCGFMLAFASCANEDIVQKKTDTDTDSDKNLTTFVTGDEPTSRTTMDYDTGAFYWEAGDHIYVQDDDNVWQKSNNAPTTKVTAFMFKVPGKFFAKTSYKVYYPGKNGSNNQVTIPAAQTQTTPNSTAHFGVSGDCGTADANKVASTGRFNFKLDHQAAILVFQPYTHNSILKDCYLTKVEVSADDDIASTYTLDPTTGELTGTGSGKQIILTTKSSIGVYVNGFPLNTTSASVTTNGAYMLIKPGTHKLKVRYWIKQIATGIEGTITKGLKAFNYAKNTYYDMAADLDKRVYSGYHYYMWDAKRNYWADHEWDTADPWQPTQNGGSNPNFPKDKTTDPDRWYNDAPADLGVRLDATQSCATAPNINEMAWYVVKGDPRWDADELWTAMGRLHKSGMWFLKKSHISGYSKEHAPDGRPDARTTEQNFGNPSIVPTLPEASVAANYFFLPTLGYYSGDRLYGLGEYGSYWSSSAVPTSLDNAYGIIFHNIFGNPSLDINTGNSRVNTHIGLPFTDFGDE